MPTVRSPWTLEWPRMGEMPAPGRPKVALEQQQVRDLLDQFGPSQLLGDAHAVADHRRTGADIDFGAAADLRLLDAGRGDDVGPCEGQDLVADRLDADRVFGEEIVIENRLAGRFPLEHDLHHALQQREVAADPDVHELAGDRGSSRTSPSARCPAAR